MFKSKIYIAIYYASIIFLLIYLFNSQTLSFSNLNINLDFFISIFFLTSGFFTYPLVLNQVLISQGIKSDYLTCFTSLGRTIFSKYIPGKAAMVYAIAYNINKRNDETGIARLSYNVILFQLMIIISGLLTGLFAVLRIQELPIIWKTGSLLVIVLSIFILQSEFFFKKTGALISKWTGKEIIFPHFAKKDIFIILVTSILFWLFWGAGIYFLAVSSVPGIINPPLLIFLFPFSVCVGILAIIAPGGIGVREGVFAFMIISVGNSPKTAAELSIISRIWFLTGEIILFLISHIFSYLYTKPDREKQ